MIVTHNETQKKATTAIILTPFITKTDREKRAQREAAAKASKQSSRIYIESAESAREWW